MNKINIHGQEFTTGDYIRCYIHLTLSKRLVEINDARIDVRGVNRFYIYQNLLNGSPSSGDRMGYRYSWLCNVKRDGTLSGGVSDFEPACNKPRDIS